MTARHLFVCTNARGSGKPTCGTHAATVIARVQQGLLERGATEILVTATGCLGPCFDGPNAVIYPEGIWYGHLEAADAPALVDYLIDGPNDEIPLAAKRTERPGG